MAKRWWLWLLLWGAVAGLLYLALRQVPLAQLAAILRRLSARQILTLVVVNLAYLMMINTRWWLILRSLGHPLPLAVVAAYRLAGFGLSYVTPGPQVGGEPLQVHLLYTRRAVPLPQAISSVVLDRLFDFLVNFTFLVFGCSVMLVSGVLGPLLKGAIALPVIMLLLPAGHIAALWFGKLPLSAAMGWLAQRTGWQAFQRSTRVTQISETQLSQLVRTRPGLMLALLGISLAGWLAALVEFWLTLAFLGISAGFAEIISAITAARIAFLLPMPAGLGALEAAQVSAARALGWGTAAGAAISIMIRARDVLFALMGLAIGGWAAHPGTVKGIQHKEGSSQW